MSLCAKVLATSLVLVCLGNVPSASNCQQDCLKYTLRNPYVGRLTHKISIYNPGPSRIFEATLYVPLVNNDTARHFAYIHSISPTPEKISVDGYGNCYAKWRTQIPKGESFEARISYDVLSFDVDFSIDESTLGSYNESSAVFQDYTKPEELIESDTPAIVSAAESVTGDIADVQDAVSRIYDYVRDTLTYTKQTEERGALWALENRRGDCSEYSYLFVALCRAVDIPARVKAGYAFRSDSEIVSDGHMWGEYYLENYGWVPTDVSWGSFASLDNLHLSAIQSIPQLASYSNYFFNFTGISHPQHEQTVILEKASADILSDRFAQALYNVTLRNSKVEQGLFLSRLVGSSLFFPTETDEGARALKDADLSLQRSVDRFGDLKEGSVQELMETASSKSEFADGLVGNLVLRTVILDVVFLAIIITVIAVLLVRRKKATATSDLQDSYRAANDGFESEKEL